MIAMTIKKTMSSHEHLMKLCIDLAVRGLGYTSPNPLVGSVIVVNETIIGQGYHEVYGGPHAEVNAINSVMDSSLLKEATLYVNLEPCNHFGKTPPCSHLIIEKHIPRVVIGASDPYPEVNGSGIQKLKEAGVEVITSVMEKECKDLNKRFYKFNLVQKPYIILKWAQTMDGFVGYNHQETGHSLKITNLKTNQLVHLWRSQEQAILAGKNTVLKDDPMLNVRLIEGRQPIPIILSNPNDIPSEYKIHQNDPMFISKGENQLNQLYQFCSEKKIQSILVEGGPEVHTWMIKENIWDEIRIITNTDMHIGSGIPAPIINDSPAETHRIENDRVQIFYNRRTW